MLQVLAQQASKQSMLNILKVIVTVNINIKYVQFVIPEQRPVANAKPAAKVEFSVLR